MFPRFRTSAALTAATALTAYILYALLTPPPWAVEPPPGPDIAPKPAYRTLTAESGTLKFEFSYPLDWKQEPIPAPGATLSAVLVPEQTEIGTRIEFALLDGDNAAKANRNAPLVSPDATTTGKATVDIGGHKFHRTEWHGELRGEPTYRHVLSLEGAIGARFVVLRCYTGAPAGKGDEANERFEKRRQEFAAVLRSARIVGVLGAN